MSKLSFVSSSIDSIEEVNFIIEQHDIDDFGTNETITPLPTRTLKKLAVGATCLLAVYGTDVSTLPRQDKIIHNVPMAQMAQMEFDAQRPELSTDLIRSTEKVVRDVIQLQTGNISNKVDYFSAMEDDEELISFYKDSNFFDLSDFKG